MRILDAGECALVVEFGTVIDDALSARVLALDAALAAIAPVGLRETVPTYRSLMALYDPLVLARSDLVAAIHRALAAPRTLSAAGRLWMLPVCYDASLAPDLDHIAATCGLTQAQVIRLHQTATLTVVMYGFAPGWAYLSDLPALTLPRRATPRDRIAGGSLIIAGGQAIVAGGTMPSGWHILGRTPEVMFAPARTPAVLFQPGDRLRFDAVDRAAFDLLSARAAAGETLARIVP